MMINTNCAICDTPGNSKILYDSNISNDSFTVQIFSARRTPDQLRYQWVRCIECGLLRSDPVSKIDLEILYTNSSFDYSSEVGGLNKTYVKIFKKVMKDTNRVDSVFEVGGGNGFFLEELGKIGIPNLIEVEPSKNAISSAISESKVHFIQNIMKEGLIKEQSQDVSVMFHTLDHLPDPLDTLRLCMSALAPGGKFIAAVHNERAFSSRLLKHRSPIFDIEHTYLYNKATAENLLMKAGFINVGARTYLNYYSFAYILHLLPLPLKFKSLILQNKFGRVLSKIKVWLPLGNIYIYGTKP
jgi:SAM-dependent methyltransferase